MYDENQKIYDVSFKDKFGIKYPPFILNKNIRNTSAIHNWVINQTGIGTNIKCSGIEGLEPEIYNCIDEKYAVFKLEFLLNMLTKQEYINNSSIVILSNLEFKNSILINENSISNYIFFDYET